MTTTQERPGANLIEARKRIEGVILSQAFRSRIAQVAAATIQPERLARVFLSTTAANPTLLKCTPESIALSLMRCAVVGLEPDGVLGEAYLVPYYNNKLSSFEAQYQPGYKGLCKLARQSGFVADIWAEVVYDGDRFHEERGMTPRIEHVPCKPADRKGLLAAYACVRFADGATRAKVIYQDEIDKVKELVKRRGRGNLTGPWLEHEAEMWKKTAIIRLCKTLPQSVAKVAEEVEHTDASMGGDVLEGTFATVEQPASDPPADNVPAAADVYDRYIERLAKCETVGDAGKVYDEFFGPDAAYRWTPEQEAAGAKARTERNHELRNK